METAVSGEKKRSLVNSLADLQSRVTELHSLERLSQELVDALHRAERGSDLSESEKQPNLSVPTLVERFDESISGISRVRIRIEDNIRTALNMIE